MTFFTNTSSSPASFRLSQVALLTAGLLGAAGAHAEIFESQGTLKSMTDNRATNGTVTIVCGTLTATVDANTIIRSPTRRLTIADLLNPAPFANSGFNGMTGAPRAGFLGGSCVAIGDDAVVPGRKAVLELDVEIEETLLLGAKTAGAGHRIQDVPVVPLTDARMSSVKLAAGFYAANGSHPGMLAAALPVTIDSVTLAPSSPNLETARMEFGFGVDLSSVPVGDLGSAEGYHGTDGQFYAYIIETSGGRLLRSEPRPSALRAQCRNDLARPRDEIEVRGGCVMPLNATTATVTVEGVLPNGTVQTYGTAVCTASPDVPAGPNYRVGLYRYGATNLTLANNACPANIRVRTTQAGVTRFDFIQVDAR